MSAALSERDALVLLTLAKGWGPVIIRSAIESLGSATAVLGASARTLESRIERVGVKRAEALLRAASAPESRERLKRELELARTHGVELATLFEESAYPPLLAPLPDAPPVLYVKGELAPERDRFSLAIVGTRSASAYGIEQAERFSAFLADAGLVIVSGGARGIDTAAHRAALRAGGRTIVVAGAGLANPYPPENADLFDRIAREGGAVISEFPMTFAASPENFPRRNRIISGASLGVLVVEAPNRSGALITARLAVEEQGREAMAIPGRIDAPGSQGCNALIRAGGAALVASPADALEMLESAARHAHLGTHAARTLATAAPGGETAGRGGAPADSPAISLYDQESALLEQNLTEAQRQLLEVLAEPRTLDEVLRETGLSPAVARAETTVLEIRRLVVREGGRLVRRGVSP